LEKIVKDFKKSIVLLTGAGISAESGIQTFRDSNGLWENHSIEEVASPVGFATDPVTVWRFYTARRKQALECKPNAGHIAIAQLEKKILQNGGEFLLVTQNVDGLHFRAGSKNIVEIHGSLLFSRCTKCNNIFKDEKIYRNLPPYHNCSEKGMLRPHIVWFGESLFPGDMEKIEKQIAKCDLFISIGTSGVVYPAAGLAAFAKSLGKETICVNKDIPANIDVFNSFCQGEAGKLLPDILF
jgi:NAD-dependent deacetylase